MTRLNRADVERKITEMWSAHGDIVDERDRERNWYSCTDAEAELRERLRKQELLDEAAPELLEVLTAVKEYFDESAFGRPIPLYKRVKAAIIKATYGNHSQPTE